MGPQASDPDFLRATPGFPPWGSTCHLQPAGPREKSPDRVDSRRGTAALIPFSIRPSFPHMGGGCFVLQTSLPSVSTKCHRNQLTFLLTPSAKRWLASPLVSMNTGVIVQPLVLSQHGRRWSRFLSTSCLLSFLSAFCDEKASVAECAYYCVGFIIAQDLTRALVLTVQMPYPSPHLTSLLNWT